MVEATEERESESRAILVGAGEDRQMGELGRLAETLGLEVAGTIEQGRRDGVGYLGRGKREELGELVKELGAGVVVTDDELSPAQARVLEKSAGAPRGSAEPGKAGRSVGRRPDAFDHPHLRGPC